ncbi:MAG TPA: amidoligase family protein [Salinarimonas sp.]|nr:amidoligase family protein [Salinarimonas sp.]
MSAAPLTDSPAEPSRHADFDLPPILATEDGSARAVGIEVEFAGLSAEGAAAVVQEALGGTIEQDDPHAFRVRGTAIGDLSVEIDSRLVHPTKTRHNLIAEVGSRLASLFGAATSHVIPCELVTGPLPMTQVHRFDDAVDALRRAGARGTQDGAFYAFGLHFNPQAPGSDVAAILPILKAFVLLNAWLRRQVAPDATRSLMGFADPFPAPYVRRIAEPAYAPDLAAFIDDYLAANPTRNRDLDLLPLLTHLDEARVRAVLPDEKIGARPTFHYRLPDARVSDPGWSIAPDWNRWVAVERVASDPDRLERLGAAYLAFPGDEKSWADRAERIAFA